MQEAERYCYLRKKKKELVIVQEAEYSYYRTPCVIQQLLLYYYARADTSRKLVQEAEYPSSYYYDMVCLGWQLIRCTNEFSGTMCGSGGEKTYVLCRVRACLLNA